MLAVAFIVIVLIAIGLGGLYIAERRQNSHLVRNMQEATQERATLQKQVQQSKEIYEALINAIDDGLILLDQDQKVLIANARAIEMGETPMVGESLVASLRHTDIDDLFREIKDGHLDHIEQMVTFNDNIMLNVRLQEATVNGKRNFLMILRDVTALKRAETARTDMVANITHELNTPISTIMMVAENLADENLYKTKKSKEVLEQLRSLKIALSTMSQVVGEMKDLSKIESDRLSIIMVPVSIHETAQNAVSSVQPLADDRKISITIDLDENMQVFAQQYYLERVLKNIVHNAIKFSPDDGTGCIRIYAEQAEDSVIVHVEDNGKGIPAEELPRIFERFFQVDRSRRDGTGLGLAIAKHIIRKHGGEIWVDSIEGKGSTFSFELLGVNS